MRASPETTMIADQTADGAMVVLRTWRNDGADGESAHLVCDYVQQLRAELARYRERDRVLAEGLAELERIRKGESKCESCGEVRKHLWHECRK